MSLSLTGNLFDKGATIGAEEAEEGASMAPGVLEKKSLDKYRIFKILLMR